MRSPARLRSVVRRPVVAAAGAALALALALAACGVPTQSSAHRIAPEDVPFGLLQAPDAATSNTSGRAVDVYLVRDDRLLPVRRSVSGTGLGEVLTALSKGPTEAEGTLGIASPLPPGQIASVKTERGVARVDLKASFADLRTSDQPTAIAQIVFTLTAQPGIGRVSFTLDGASVEIPRGDGSLTTDAVARDDYPELAPKP